VDVQWLSVYTQISPSNIQETSIGPAKTSICCFKFNSKLQ